jgi:hypothetical protein
MADDLENYQVQIRYLAHEMGELLADRVRRDPRALPGITQALALFANAASGSWCCRFPNETICPYDVSACLASHGWPTMYQGLIAAKPQGAPAGVEAYLRQLLQGGGKW